MNEIHEALARHDEEHYYLPADDPAVQACVFCDGGDEDDDPLEDANGYTRSDLLFGGNW